MVEDVKGRQQIDVGESDHPDDPVAFRTETHKYCKSHLQ